jgi:hypothetical protein
MITGTVSRHAAFVFFGVRRTDHTSIRDHAFWAFARARCRFPPPCCRGSRGSCQVLGNLIAVEAEHKEANGR